MDKILVRGGSPLKGKISIGGSKNSALPIISGVLMAEQPVILDNVPKLEDIKTMHNLLSQHGVSIVQTGDNSYSYNASNITSLTAPYDIVRKMRASILVLGPLLARFGQAKVSLPGGCAIGARPVDLHLKALEEMGAQIEIVDGYVNAKCVSKLKGAHIVFPKVSVGATENIVMAACLAEGITTIENAAQEPEISDLCDFLNKLGAKITGVGTATLVIQGVEKLGGCHHRVIPDRIVAGTFAIAASITGGDLILTDLEIAHCKNILNKLEETGTKIEYLSDKSVRISNTQRIIKPIDIKTEAFPGFPTDIQAQFMTLLSLASGKSSITENIFENRFMHASELTRMNANIVTEGNTALVTGVDELHGAEVMASDLRASVSLILAGLAATGETIINRVYHLDRGYEDIEAKLSACGADIQRIHFH